MFRLFGRRKRGHKAVAPPKDPVAYSEALLSGWVPPPDARPPQSTDDGPPENEKQDDTVIERFYRSQQ